MEILTYTITTIIGIVIGSIVTKTVKYIKSEKAERKALLMILQNNLTNLAYVCMDIGYIMDYQLQSWCNMLNAYEELGGNDYIHSLDSKIKQLPVKKTDILQND